jgi:hypothetical protein
MSQEVHVAPGTVADRLQGGQVLQQRLRFRRLTTPLRRLALAGRLSGVVRWQYDAGRHHMYGGVRRGGASIAGRRRYGVSCGAGARGDGGAAAGDDALLVVVVVVWQDGNGLRDARGKEGSSPRRGLDKRGLG